MAKRRQPAGMQRRKEGEEDIQRTGFELFLHRLLGEPESRSERDEAISRLLTRSITAVTGIIVVIIAAVIIFDQFVIPNQPVVTVNGQSVSVNEYRQRVRFERARLTTEINQVVAQAQQIGIDPNQLFQQEPYSRWISEVNFPDQLGQRVLDDIVEDLLIAQETNARNINVYENEIQSEINDFFGYDPTQVALIGADPTETPTPQPTVRVFVSPTPSATPLPTATPTPLPELTAEATAETTEEAVETPEPNPTLSVEEVRSNFEENISNFREQLRTEARVSDATIDDYFRRLALREALRENVTAEENTATYASVRHILVETEEQALEIRDALLNGESFVDLARANSSDGSAASGGELGDAPITNYVQEFQDAVRDAEIGTIVGPVQTQFGQHIIQVRDREEREAEGNELEQIQQQVFNEYLENLRDENDPNIQIVDNWVDYVPQN